MVVDLIGCCGWFIMMGSSVSSLHSWFDRLSGIVLIIIIWRLLSSLLCTTHC